jgi:putative flippase GtrA
MLKEYEVMMNLTLLPRHKEFSRIIQFGVVGVSGTVLDYIVLILLKLLLGWPTLLANSLAFSIGVANNYTWNSRWTFANPQTEGSLRQFIQFFLVSVIGLLLNNAIVLGLEAPMGHLIAQPEWGYLPAKVLATSLVMFWNYFANRYWTFRTVNETE